MLAAEAQDCDRLAVLLHGLLLRSPSDDLCFDVVVDAPAGGERIKRVIRSLWPSRRVPLNVFVYDESWADARLAPGLAVEPVARVRAILATSGAIHNVGKTMLRSGLKTRMNFVRYFWPRLMSVNAVVERVVYMDNDVIVNGDVAEMAMQQLERDGDVALATTSWLAFGNQYDCRNSLDAYGNSDDALVSKLDLDPWECALNAGLFVADASRWWRARGTQELLMWWSRDSALNEHEFGHGSQVRAVGE